MFLWAGRFRFSFSTTLRKFVCSDKTNVFCSSKSENVSKNLLFKNFDYHQKMLLRSSSPDRCKVVQPAELRVPCQVKKLCSISDFCSNAGKDKRNSFFSNFFFKNGHGHVEIHFHNPADNFLPNLQIIQAPIPKMKNQQFFETKSYHIWM